jgi:uncharacterized membrane protein YfcA
MSPLSSTLLLLAGFTVAYAGVWGKALWDKGKWETPSLLELFTGLITNFFDTLGIGSFATTTTIFRFARMVSDELIPGTLNVGHTLPVILQAFLYIAVIEVDFATLALMIAGATAGAWLGAGVVARLPKTKIRIGLGIALLTAFIAMLMRQLSVFPAGGDALGLRGGKLLAAILVNAFIGAISTLGIGVYAPSMTLVSLLGMNPKAAFPIMMGSGAFLMPVASSRFILSHAYSPRVALGLTIGGLIGVPIAAFLVKSLPLDAVRWLVMAVVLYAAQGMLCSARKGA